MSAIKFTKPSKKIASLLIVVVAIISGILIIKYGQSHKPSAGSLSYSVTDITSFNAKNDPNSDQTQLDNIISATNPAYTDDATDTANASDLVARSLYSGYMSLSNSGDTSSDSAQNLATGIASAATQSFSYDVYSSDNLKIIASPSKDQIKSFATSLATIQNNIFTGLQNEDSKSGNVNLKNVSQIYKNAASNIYDLAVPVDIANPVLEIINNYSMIASVYVALDNGDKDPVTAAVALKYWQDASNSQNGYLDDLAKYFNYSGIIFTSDEIGSYWNSDFSASSSPDTSSAATPTQ